MSGLATVEGLVAYARVELDAGDHGEAGIFFREASSLAIKENRPDPEKVELCRRAVEEFQRAGQPYERELQEAVGLHRHWRRIVRVQRLRHRINNFREYATIVPGGREAVDVMVALGECVYDIYAPRLRRATQTVRRAPLTAFGAVIRRMYGNAGQSR